MKKNCLTLLLLLFSPLTFAQWSQLSSMEGGDIDKLLVTSSAVFAGGRGGLYKSSDEGKSWNFMGKDASRVSELFEKNHVLFIDKKNRCYKSLDEGENWQEIKLKFDNGYQTFSVFNNALYFLYGKNGTTKDTVQLYISTDDGNTSTLAATFLTKEYYETRLYSTGNKLYIVNDTIRYTSNGNTFVTLSSSGLPIPSSGFPDEGIYHLVDTGGGPLLICQNKIYKYTGSVWKPSTNGIPTAEKNNTLNVVNGVLFTSTFDMSKTTSPFTMYRSIDNGNHWDQLNTNGLLLNTLTEIKKLNNGSLIAASYDALYTSTDNGINWLFSNKNLLGTFPSGIVSLKNQLFTDNRNKGIFRSADEGKTFTLVNQGLPSGFAIYTNLYASHTTLYISCETMQGSNIYKSVDNGNNWNILNVPPDSVNFSIAGTSKQRVFLRGFDYTNKVGYYYYSVDEGLHWQQISAPENFIAADFIEHGKDIYIRGQGELPFYKSTDTGKTWQADTVGLGKKTLGELFYDHDSTLYYFSFPNLYIRGKEKWELKYTNIPSAYLKDIYSYQNFLYIIGLVEQDIIYYTNKDSSKFKPLNAGFYENIYIQNLAFLQGKIFAATEDNGIWEMYSFPLGMSSKEPYSVSGLNQNFPNPANTLTTINFQVQEPGKVTIQLYTLDGKWLQEIVNENKNPGNYQAHVDISNLATGIYIYQLITPNNILSKKMVVMR